MKRYIACWLRGRRACRARHGSDRGPAEDRQDRLHQLVQRPGRRDRQRHAQFVRARARPSRPQDRRHAGRGDLRGRPDQAGSRRAEDPEADRVRQGRLHGRLHLVERGAGFAEAAGRFQDHHLHHQRRRLADRRRAVLALRVHDLLEQRPDAAGRRSLHEPEEREDGVPDRPELRRRQGHARGRRRDLQGPDRRPRADRVAEPARLLRRAVEGARRQARRDLRVLSRRRRHPVRHAVRAVGPEGPDSALHRVHHRRAVDAAAEGPRRRHSRARSSG